MFPAKPNFVHGNITFVDTLTEGREIPVRQYRDLIAEQGLDHLRAGVGPLPKLRYPRLAALGRWLIRISYTTQL